VLSPGTKASSMSSSTQTNYLLSELATPDLEFLNPHLQRHDMPLGAVLTPQGEPAEYVYFPHKGLISLVVHLEGGGSVEAVVVGRDGMLGPSTALANPPSHSEAVVQLSGNASRLSVRLYKEVYAQSAGLRSLAARYSEYMTVQAQQGAACNATHEIPARLARWLLRARDLMDDDVLPFTQEFLSHMLGVRRPSVNAAVQALDAAGHIGHTRGCIEVLDRDGLRGASCECYGTLKKHYHELFPGAGQHLRLVSGPRNTTS
jgi:CRP-like cAMP-binding protein